LAQLVYETTDLDFADRAIAAMRAANIPCYRVGDSDTVAAAQYTGRALTENQISVYIERDSDYVQANRILIGLGAAVERPPSWRAIVAILLIAAIVALLVVVTWK
jgi:hypothetical protein